MKKPARRDCRRVWSKLMMVRNEKSPHEAGARFRQVEDDANEKARAERESGGHIRNHEDS
jgi:hypothetical protein